MGYGYGHRNEKAVKARKVEIALCLGIKRAVGVGKSRLEAEADV